MEMKKMEKITGKSLKKQEKVRKIPHLETKDVLERIFGEVW